MHKEILRSVLVTLVTLAIVNKVPALRRLVS